LVFAALHDDYLLLDDREVLLCKKQTGRQTDRPRGRQADRQAGRQTERETGRERRQKERKTGRDVDR